MAAHRDRGLLACRSRQICSISFDGNCDVFSTSMNEESVCTVDLPGERRFVDLVSVGVVVCSGRGGASMGDAVWARGVLTLLLDPLVLSA